MHPAAYHTSFHPSGIPVPKPSKDEVLEQLQNLPQQEEVR